MINKTVLNVLLMVSAVVLVGWYFSDIVIYFIISLVLSAILRVPTNYISQAQFMGFCFPRAGAILVSYLILAGVIALFVTMFIPLVSEQIEVISGIDFEQLIQQATVPLAHFEAEIVSRGLAEDGFIMDKVKEYTGSSEFMDNLNLGQLAGSLINNILSITGSFFVGLLAVLFITFFLLYEKGIVRKTIISIVPNNYFEVTVSAFTKVERLLSNYLVGLLLQMFSIFTIASFGLLIGGVKYAVSIGVFAALANLIPYVGPFLGASFGLIVGISTSPINDSNDFVILLIKIITVFGIVQVTDNVLLQPIIFSRSVKAHPLEIFVIIFAGAAIAGPLGMVSAIPAYTILRVSVVEFYKGYKQYQVFRH